MRGIALSIIGAIYLYGAEPQGIVGDVAKLRQKYEECREQQKNSPSNGSEAKISGYQKRITVLENQLKQTDSELQKHKQESTRLERELSQKKGVIQSLERSLTSKDQKYREVSAQNDRLLKEANGVKVSKIERENLKRALIKAKTEFEQLEKTMGKNDKEVVVLRASLADAKEEISKLRFQTKGEGKPSIAIPTDQSEKIKALQNELTKANALITQLQKSPPKTVVEEKIVTKVVEPTEKITALQRELSAAHATIANLKKAPSGKERVIEKIVYKDRPVVQEKIVEKVVYKERPIVQEKIVTKVVEPTEKIALLQEKLAHAQEQLAHYKSKPTVPKTFKAPSSDSVEKRGFTPQKEEVKGESAPSKKSKSSAYRMAANAPIYNAPGGSHIDTWEARRSFTAGNPSGGWVHITGYFVNRVWQPTAPEENLYVRESDVIRR